MTKGTKTPTLTSSPDPCQQRTAEARQLCRAIRAGQFDTDPEGFRRAVASIYAEALAEERERALQDYRAGKRTKE